MKELLLSEFDYHLPEELIAQTPLKNRSTSRLMVLNRDDESITHDHFYNILDYLKEGDVLVRNNTKVIPARLFGTKEITGAHVELLILKQDEKTCECLVGNAKVVKLGTVVSFGNGELKAKCIEVKDEGIRIFELIYEGIFLEILDKLGHVPLPPYIKEKLEDKDRYNTVYAKIEGSAAAPTAGLHFTDDIFNKLKEKNIEVLDVTLHVGLGTFRPVSEDNVLNHKMHSEFYMMDEEVATKLNKAKKEGRRIISVGTTSTRVLETVMNKYGEFKECQGDTDIFIYPGYEFKCMDGLITNFHLPESTLIMLVSAFLGYENTMNAYRSAVEKKYRFFSFGDAMLIV